MNKLLASLLVGAFALSINTTVFAADAVASEDAAVTTAPAADASKVEAAKPVKKLHHKHTKKTAKLSKVAK